MKARRPCYAADVGGLQLVRQLLKRGDARPGRECLYRGRTQDGAIIPVGFLCWLHASDGLFCLRFFLLLLLQLSLTLLVRSPAGHCHVAAAVLGAAIEDLPDDLIPAPRRHGAVKLDVDPRVLRHGLRQLRHGLRVTAFGVQLLYLHHLVLQYSIRQTQGGGEEQALLHPLGHTVQRRLRRVAHDPLQHVDGQRARRGCKPVQGADLGSDVLSGGEAQLLPAAKHAQPPRRLHQFVLAGGRPQCEHAHGVGAQLQVGAAAARLVVEHKRITLGNGRGVACEAAAITLQNHP